jgi:hypothetical protein
MVRHLSQPSRPQMEKPKKEALEEDESEVKTEE